MALNTTLNATMRGAMLTGPYQVHIQDFPVPVMNTPTDAIVRITTSALCGSDLHRYHGYMGGNPPWALGHEASKSGPVSTMPPF